MDQKDCPVCNQALNKKMLKIDASMTLQQFIDMISADYATKLKNPSVSAAGSFLYTRGPEALEVATRPNLGT